MASKQQLEVGHYSRSQLILFVGEGSFAFSSMLATHFGSAPNIYATSIDSYDTFCARYGADGGSNVNNLTARGAHVCFGVDITMAATSVRYANSHTVQLLSKKFDRIIFNYPHAGYLRDGSKSSFPQFYHGQHHKDLIQSFFCNASQTLLRTSGEIHITHKTTVHKRWKFNRSATSCGLSLKRSLWFVPESFLNYVPCRGAGNNWVSTFPLGRGSKTYMYVIDWSSPF